MNQPAGKPVGDGLAHRRAWHDHVTCETSQPLNDVGERPELGTLARRPLNPRRRLRIDLGTCVGPDDKQRAAG